MPQIVAVVTVSFQITLVNSFSYLSIYKQMSFAKLSPSVVDANCCRFDLNKNWPFSLWDSKDVTTQNLNKKEKYTLETLLRYLENYTFLCNKN